MAVKVAVASSDGKVVNRHFGHSKVFLIFKINSEGFEFLETRENTPPCNEQEHHDDKLLRSVELLADCGAVLVSQIGLGAAQLLKSRGITPYVIPDFIDEALKKLISAGKIDLY